MMYERPLETPNVTGVNIFLGGADVLNLLGFTAGSISGGQSYPRWGETLVIMCFFMSCPLIGLAKITFLVKKKKYKVRHYALAVALACGLGAGQRAGCPTQPHTRQQRIFPALWVTLKAWNSFQKAQLPHFPPSLHLLGASLARLGGGNIALDSLE